MDPTKRDNGSYDEESKAQEPDRMLVNGASRVCIEEVCLLLCDVAEGVKKGGDDSHDNASDNLPHLLLRQKSSAK